MTFAVEITPEGARRLHRLPTKVLDAAVALIYGALADKPRPVGKPLVGELEGLWSARRGDYRIVYEIDDDEQVLLIHRIQHRADAYRRR